MIYRLGNLIPKIGKNNFIAKNADVIGDVETGEEVSIWFGARVRGDIAKIKIGNRSNIQDNVTIHCDEDFPVLIGEKVTVGHNTVLHGCEIGDETVIGMGSTVLNGSFIPKGCLVGAGSLVTPKLKAEEGDLIIGNPAKVIRKLSDKNREYLKFAYKEYVDEIKRYSKELVKMEEE